MRKNLLTAFCAGLLANALVSAPASSQTLQSFTQQDFETLIKNNPQLLDRVVKPDGSIDRVELEKILRLKFGYVDQWELEPGQKIPGLSDQPYRNRNHSEIEKDIMLQKKLAEERRKALEASKPPQ